MVTYHNGDRHGTRHAARRIAAAAALITFLTVGSAQAVSVKEIIELTQAGVSEEVLVALVQTGRTVFTLDAAQILALKSAGVSDRVVVAMTETSRPAEEVAPGLPVEAEPGAAAEPDPAAGQQWLPALGGVVGGPPPRQEDLPATVVVIVPAPFLVPYVVPQPANGSPQIQSQPYLTGYRGFGRFMSDGSARFANDGFIDNAGSLAGKATPGRFINDGSRPSPAPRKRP